jgi:abequosyltransferase
MTQPPCFKLSICISTYNRAAFIGATLKSIIDQATSECEIVVLDGASTDETERVVSGYVCESSRLRYVRQNENNGVDRDFDRAVELARGEYCWLMSDDDLLKPGALSAVLQAIQGNLSLVLVNAELRDFSLSNVVHPNFFNVGSNCAYGPGEMDRLFSEMGEYLGYIGCVVIKRAIWLAREKERYYGSMFIHVGVIFQEHLPGTTLVIAEPFIIIRGGNTHSFWAKGFEIMLFRWPSLVWSLAPSETAKIRVCTAEPWRNLQPLLLLRALGLYSLPDYRRWIRPRLHSRWESVTPIFVVLLPGVLVTALFVIYYSVTGRQRWVLSELRNSRFHLRNWRTFNRGS